MAEPRPDDVFSDDITAPATDGYPLAATPFLDAKQCLAGRTHDIGLQHRVHHSVRGRRNAKLTPELDDLAVEPGQFEAIAAIEIERHRRLHGRWRMADEIENLVHGVGKNCDRDYVPFPCGVGFVRGGARGRGCLCRRYRRGERTWFLQGRVVGVGCQQP